MKLWTRIEPLRWLRVICISITFWISVRLVWGRGLFDRAPHRISDGDRPWRTSDGVPSLLSAETLCSRHGWKPFQAPFHDATTRKVYDLIMVNNELDWLEIRLNSTYDHVDYFVIVEASQTFTGHPKPLSIKDNFDNLKPYHDKIIYHLLEYPADFNPKRTWDREDLQRDATFTQVFPRLVGAQAPKWGDVLLVADVDEIPRPQTLEVLRACAFPRRLTLRSKFYYYSFQFLHRGPEWAHPQATYYDGPSRTVLPVNLRNGDGGLQPLIYWDKADLWNAGWHCSSCFRTMEELLNKMSSFSHVWMNAEEYRNRDRIADRVRNGKDIWDRAGEVYDRIDGNSDVPRLLLDESERFPYLLSRDGKTAGFEDYHQT